MNTSPLALEALILTGGKSSRMGCPKALLGWKKSTLLEHLCEIIRPEVRCVKVVGAFSPAPFPFGPSIEFIDEADKVGPLGGIFAGLKTVKTEKTLVVACDMPFITRLAIRRLWENSPGFDVVIPRTSDGLHPLFGIYSKACLPFMEGALSEGKRRPIAFFPFVKVHELEVNSFPENWIRILRNINSQDDYQEALKEDR